MAEQVNQRIEDMINELEQMRRTNLFDDEEIREISRKRKEFEYRIQRRIKQKEDFVQYITYELALLKQIASRRKEAKLTEKKKDIEYSIAKRLNKVFKQFIYRYQNEIEIYFEYIRFCKGVGFDHAISGIIGQMLQIHGDKPKMWQLASKWEHLEQNNIQGARDFLLKGLHRHPEADVLYLELFQIELTLCSQATSDEEKEKQIKRADIVWKNSVENVDSISFLCKLYDVAVKYEADLSIISSIKEKIWSNKDCKEVWAFIACKELDGQHWQEIDDFVDKDTNYSEQLQNYLGVFEEALQRFPDVELCTQFIHNLLSANESVCTDTQKISVVKKAWYYGHENALLSEDMFQFGIDILKAENKLSSESLIELLNNASSNINQGRFVWEEKLKLSKSDDSKMLAILKEATKILKVADAVFLWNFLLENTTSKATLKNMYRKFQNCEHAVLLALKPKLLQKIYENDGLKAARDIYEEMTKSPPTQVELHTTMIEIEKFQQNKNTKNMRRIYECLVQQHGNDNIEVWMDYMKFESEYGNAQSAPNIYRRAIGSLKKELVDKFITTHTLLKLK